MCFYMSSYQLYVIYDNLLFLAYFIYSNILNFILKLIIIRFAIMIMTVFLLFRGWQYCFSRNVAAIKGCIAIAVSWCLNCSTLSEFLLYKNIVGVKYYYLFIKCWTFVAIY